MSTLVIVESPTKARTISKFLPSSYVVKASMGHVRDLPPSAEEIPPEYKSQKWANLGINVESGFAPLYIIPKDKRKIVQELKTALKGASELILATDEDREGESISWHLLQLLNPKVPTKRMVFHEITKEAIQKALKNCREIDEQIVHAQETRRILDRLVGYTLSPLLWRKIAGGLSAGRVQSVAVRLLVMKERQRRAFKSAQYWDLKALLAHNKAEFDSKLVTVDGVKVATGADFDPNTGNLLAGKKVKVLNGVEAKALTENLKGKTWTVTGLEEKPVTRKPSPPFTTSTLQQESNRKLRLSARETMRVAQSLYEQGYITYMRTDSVHLSAQAIDAARSCVLEKYGQEYLSPKPRQYTTKAKGAQEAHEAIRPAGSSFRTPRETGLAAKELQLYDLVWKRTVASQMADARQTQLSVDLQVENAGFRSSGKRIDFAGYLRAYVEGSDDPNAAIEDQEIILPQLVKGDRPDCKKLDAIDHETQPPARYTEASLVKMLESEGIGRPSTYASIIGTIIDRGYAQLQSNALVPSFTAFAVTALLEKNFPDLVDPSFTARMEQTLDDISTGTTPWLPYLEKFYLGEKGLENLVNQGFTDIDATLARTIDLDNLDVKVRIGKFGAFIETESGNASIPKDLTPADLAPETIEMLLKQKSSTPDTLGNHPETGEPIYPKLGPFGPYVQLGDKEEDSKKKPKQSSLPKGMKLEDVTLEIAIELLKLPRSLGVHPETGGKLQTNLGRFGPYILHDRGKEGKEYRSLKATDDVLTVTLERALAILAEPKSTRGGKKEPLRTIGNHPDDNEPVAIFSGPYGKYIKHGKINAGIPEGETVEGISLETALSLLVAKGGTVKKTTTTKKTTATKAKTSATKAKTTATKAKTTATKAKTTTTKKTTTAKKTG
ncbi:MAG: type I DNA topoisomerase [Chamaesiphon sp.]|nr:type I DNA topoisomerase [Chamaesiphon sp.]